MLTKLFFKFSVALIISSCAFFKNSCAQPPANIFGNIKIASPNAASLGKYGDYPVSYNTGLPQISVPFYTVKEGPLFLPLSVSYHASGLKVLESSSCIGAGWALNAGGVITRTVMGSPDDKGYLNNNTHGHFSNYGYNNYSFDPAGGGAGNPSCYSWPEDNIAFGRVTEFVNGHRDGEPDLFFFNFGGYSGKFYFRDDRTPVIVPEDDFKIEPILSGVNDNIVGFIITTPDGVKYYFGKNQNADGNIDANEITSPYTFDNGLTFGNVISSWFLNKIKSADNKFFIDLIYQPDKFTDFTMSLFPVAADDQFNKHSMLVKNYVEGVRLSQVNFSNGNIKLLPGMIRSDLGDFSTITWSDIVNTTSKSLDTIKITDNQNFCKNFILYHSYFVDNNTSLPSSLSVSTIITDTKRLRLDSIIEKTCDNAIAIPPYKFSYTVPSADFVTRRLSFGQDHWGYYNGKLNNDVLIPTYTWNNDYKYAGADRESSWPETGYGGLNKITYPTGGNTQFNFEANDVWLTYPYVLDSYISSSSIGPQIGTTTTQTINLTTSINKYKFILDFKGDQSGNTSARAYVNGLVFEVNRANPHAQIVFTPGSGPHTYYLNETDMSSTTHDWATLQIYELLPQTYQGNTVIGGLRIKSILSNNNVTGPDSATYFNYRSGVQSTGILYSRPTYVRVLRNDIRNQVGVATAPPPTSNGCLTGGPDGSTGIGFQKSPSSLRPMETIQGNHIGYNSVEVSRTGNGKIRYQYYGSNIWDQNQTDVCIRTVNTTSCPLSLPNWPDAPLPFDYIKGELRYEGYYDQTGNLIKTNFYYPEYIQNVVTTPAMIMSYGDITYYNLTNSKKSKMTVVSSDISLTGSTLTTIDSSFFESPFHSQITRKVYIDSKGNKIETKIKYAFDFRVPNCEAISDCWQTYNTSYSNALNNFNTKINTCTNTGSCNCKWPAFQSYRYYWSLARKNYVASRRTNFTDPVNGFKTTHDSAKAGADLELKPILEMQDRYQNPIIETTVWKAGLLAGATYNKYDFTATNVYPSKTQTIKLSALSPSFTPAASTNNTLNKDSRYSDESTAKFDNGNLVEILGKDGILTSYVWSYSNTLPVVKAVGVSYSVLKPAYDAVSGDLVALRNQSSLNAAFLSTYFYTPGVGMTKETNPNGRNIYYEYDALGRLKIIRDHDNNILKKICYNYAGQPENCSPCTNITANWQNTATALRCQVINSSNTGYQEQEQKDMNPCSVTYNQTQWITAGQNASACPATEIVALTSTNYQLYTGYTASYYNTSTGNTYTFSISAASGLQSLGSIPAGSYTLTISRAVNPYPGLVFSSGCKFQTISGSSAIFYNVTISSTGCKSISIDTAA